MEAQKTAVWRNFGHEIVVRRWIWQKESRKKMKKEIKVPSLFGFSINLLAFYHECRSLIGYATHYLFWDRW